MDFSEKGGYLASLPPLYDAVLEISLAFPDRFALLDV